MSELGARLIRARESRGLTLEDAERDTRISRRYLQALESEQFDAIPAPVYARGFLRSYSQYLGLEPQQMLQLFPRDDDPAYPSQQVPQRPSPQNPMSAVGPARPTWKRPSTKHEQQPEQRPRPVGRQQAPPPPGSIPTPAPNEPYEPTIGIDIGVPVPSRRIRADPAAQARTMTIAIVALVAVVVVVGLALLISRLGGDGATPGTGLGTSASPSGTRVSRAGTVNPGGAATAVTGSSGIPTVPGTVPNVTDLTLEVARAALEEHRYKVRALESTSCVLPKGKVCDQAPPAGTKLDEDGTVNITVSKGP